MTVYYNFQTSTLISQREWYGVRDFDDCWVISAINAVFCITPWLMLVGNDAFRKVAGDPDDGVTDGGNIREIIAGVEGVWPVYKGKLKAKRNMTKGQFQTELDDGHVVSIALMGDKLPSRLRYSVGAVAHQCTVVRKGAGYYFANPMAPMPHRWDSITLEEIMPACRAYTNGNGVTGVSFPTIEEMISTHPAFGPAVLKAHARSNALGYNEGLDVAGSTVAAIPRKVVEG